MTEHESTGIIALQNAIFMFSFFWKKQANNIQFVNSIISSYSEVLKTSRYDVPQAIHENTFQGFCSERKSQ